MLHRSSIALALAVGAALAAAQGFDNQARRRCWTSGNDQPAKWWPEGSRVDRGRYWYECYNGRLDPRGCFSDTRERLYLQGRFVQDGYEMTCVLGGDGRLTFKYTACAPTGVRYEIGSSWNDNVGKYWFTCERDGDFYLRSAISGCIAEDGGRLRLGERQIKDEFIYECQAKWGGAVQMCSVGCVHNNVEYRIGDSWEDGELVYYCKIEDGRCQKICIGCQYNSRRLSDGDRFMRDDAVFQCRIRHDDFGTKPVACVQRDRLGDVERIIGCRWYQDIGSDKYEMTCVEKGETAVAEPMGCVYKDERGFDLLSIEPDTYTIWENKGIACKQVGGRLTVVEFKLEELAWQASGLDYSAPRGV